MMLIEDTARERRVQSTLARRTDPRLANRLMASGDEILGGRSVLATVLFSDIRDFTTLAEKLGPQATVHLLNEHFTLMVECLQRQGGTLDKFIGDGIMAVFGIPIAHGDEEDRAVRAAIAMVTALDSWNRRRTENGRTTLDIGIGINTDVIVYGNIGSPKRMDHTMVGDGVNLASRLESACKRYHARILISDNTLKRLKGSYRIRRVDTVVLKGKTEPVTVHEVLDHHTNESLPNLARTLTRYEEGLSLYRQGRFDAAGLTRPSPPFVRRLP